MYTRPASYYLGPRYCVLIDRVDQVAQAVITDQVVVVAQVLLLVVVVPQAQVGQVVKAEAVVAVV